MAKSSASYLQLLKALLPTGRAWDRKLGTIPEMLAGIAEELARLDAQIESLLTETRVSRTTLLIDEFESDYVLVGDCVAGAETLADRRAAVLSKILGGGSQRPAYFEYLASTLGFTAEVEEFTPAWAGVMVAGDPCGGLDNIWHWFLKILWIPDTVGGEYVWGSEEFATNLICLAHRLKPPHTHLETMMDGPAFSEAFSEAFDSGTSRTPLQGAFNGKQFSIAFDVRLGGAFDRASFSTDFDVPF